MKKRISDLLLKAKNLGLSNGDTDVIENFIKNGEFKVAIEWLIDQLYEFDIQIDQDFYDQASEIASELRIRNDKADLLRSLLFAS